MVLNLLECFLGTNPIGDTCKLGKGGVGKGPPTLPKATSLVKFSETISGCAKAVGKFFENLAMRGPVKPISAPVLKKLHSLATKAGSGCSLSTSSSLVTLIGVGRGTKCSLLVSTRGTGLGVSLVPVLPPIALVLSVFGKRGAVAPRVSPIAPVAGVLVLAHVFGT